MKKNEENTFNRLSSERKKKKLMIMYVYNNNNNCCANKYYYLMRTLTFYIFYTQSFGNFSILFMRLHLNKFDINKIIKKLIRYCTW